MTSRERTRLSVLIVEDDLDAQTNLQDILELEGYEAVTASCAGDVSSRRDLEQFDVILLDRNLPDGRGDDLLPYIRQAAPLTAVILVTGHANIEGAVTALRHGAADFLTKPIEPEVLLSRLSRISEQCRMRTALIEAQRRLIQSERLAAIGQTIAAVSHEARNELHGLKLGLSLLPGSLDDRDTALELIGHLMENQYRLHRLFEDLRGFAAPIKLERATCRVDDVWRKAWASLEPTWKHRDVSFDEQVGNTELVVSADAFRLEQVFRNMFENSLAACGDPVAISIACPPSAKHSQRISLAVRDNGPGMSREQKKKVFAAFYTTKPNGTGLGMAISKRIVEAHGGTIVVGDDAIRGAEFILTLPVGQGSIPAAERVWPDLDGGAVDAFVEGVALSRLPSGSGVGISESSLKW